MTGERLAAALMKYMDDPAALKSMGQKALKMGRGDAARVIVDQLTEMIEEGARRRA